MMKRKYSSLTLKDALQLVNRQIVQPWAMDAAPRPPSDALLTHLARLRSFDLQGSEQAKTLLIDALLAEIVPRYPQLKVWKAAPLSTDTLTGVADYAIAPFRGYLDTPLLCVVEAKRDDFEGAQVQCIAEMHACRWNNRREGHDTDVFGIISNGQGWSFLKLSRSDDLLQTGLLTTDYLPELLGALDHVCAQCAAAARGFATQGEGPASDGG